MEQIEEHSHSVSVQLQHAPPFAVYFLGHDNILNYFIDVLLAVRLKVHLDVTSAFAFFVDFCHPVLENANVLSMITLLVAIEPTLTV